MPPLSSIPSAYSIQPVFDFLVGRDSVGAVTSITTDGLVTLDGNAHGGYEFEFIFVNGSVGVADYYIYVNNDLTNGNYYEGGYGVTAGASCHFTNSGIGSGHTLVVNGEISITPGGNIVVTYRAADTNGQASFISTIVHVATQTNLTRLDWGCGGVANGIGINSRFRLWRKM